MGPHELFCQNAYIHLVPQETRTTKKYSINVPAPAMRQSASYACTQSEAGDYRFGSNSVPRGRMMSYQDVALKKYLSQVLETLKTVTQLVEMEISREPEKPPTPKPIEERVVPRPQKIITSPHKCADESDEDFRMGLLKR